MLQSLEKACVSVARGGCAECIPLCSVTETEVSTPGALIVIVVVLSDDFVVDDGKSKGFMKSAQIFSASAIVIRKSALTL